ncbi:MAG: hypothetical protein R3E31_08255 [Chloroflexota bacterium]
MTSVTQRLPSIATCYINGHNVYRIANYCNVMQTAASPIRKRHHAAAAMLPDSVKRATAVFQQWHIIKP